MAHGPRSRVRLYVFLGIFTFLLVATVGNALRGSHSSPSGGARQTVTVIVTGDQAQVTYGPAGTDLAGSVPLDATAVIPADPPAWYAVQAQLQGGGTVSCEIEVDGRAVSQGTATGGYNIASCEISQGLTGQWQDDN